MFGFGFNKAKVSSNAEKYVKQGKLHNAIAEYEKIAKEDPKDLTVLNTIGDLYARIGSTEKATDYFRRVGDAYAADGFTVKAIAMYKKLTKQDPQASEAIVKLAEFYTQQGLYNDARQQYTIVGEQFLRRSETEKAANVFQRMVEIDPDSTGLQARLAELYMKLGRTAEARDIYFRSAETLRSKGALDAADDALSHVLNLDPSFGKALLLRGLVRVDSDDPEAAVGFLEQVADLDSRPEGLRGLLKALLKLQKLPEAEPIARKLLTMFNDPAGMMAYSEALIVAGSYDAAIALISDFADRMLAWNTGAVLSALNGIVTKVKSNPRSLESLCELFQRAGDPAHLTEVSELLAHACVQAGELTRARDLYKKLAEMEPSNKQHLEHYHQVVAQLGDTKKPLPATGGEESAVLALESTGEVPPQLPGVIYNSEIVEAINAAMTEADLYESYNLPSSAVLPLESLLRSVPNDPQVNHKLATIYARMGRFPDAAARCDVISAAYAEKGCDRESRHYAAIARAYRDQSGQPPADAGFELSEAPELDGGVNVMEHPFGPERGSRSAGGAEPSFFEFDLQTEDVRPSSSSSVSSSPAPSVANGQSVTANAAVPFVEPETIKPPVPPEVTKAAPVPSAAPQNLVTASTPAAHEFDLSSEWDELFVEDKAEPVASGAGDTASSSSSYGTATCELQAADANAAGMAGELALPQPEPTPAPGLNPAAAISDLIDEANFYLSQSMLAEAESAISRCETAKPGLPEVEQLRSQLAALKAAGGAEREIPDLEVMAPAPEELIVASSNVVEFDLSGGELPAAAVVSNAAPSTAMFDLAGAAQPLFDDQGEFSQAPAASVPDLSWISQPAASTAPEHAVTPTPNLGESAAMAGATEILAVSELSMQASVLEPPALELPALEAPVTQAMEAAPAQATPPDASAGLDDWAGDLELAVGDDFVPKAPAAEQAAAAVAGVAAGSVLQAPTSSQASVMALPAVPVPASVPAFAEPAIPSATATPRPTDNPPLVAPPSAKYGLEELNFALSDVFAEFKSDMERTETVATSDDIDTHYNLGVAFREMGLMDEAIGELQKVCQAVERGANFAQAIQAYTWLANSFVQKGVPEAGIRWYEKALKLSQINDDTSLAIHYELGCAYESAGNKPSALTHFMEVYGSNIDYRDVAVRIKGLKS
jgi:tetratricopeptide (TPR) repeat protein